MPPPSVNPATPVVDMIPPGAASPIAWVAASSLAHQRPRSHVRHATVHTHAAPARAVDHERAVADREPGDVVAAAAHRDRPAALAREPHGGDDVRGRRAAHDRRGPAVDRRVPHGPRLVVAVVARCDEVEHVNGHAATVRRVPPAG